MPFAKLFLFFLTALAISAFASDALDVRILRVEFKYEETDNSLTTGRGTFDSDTKDYKLDPKGQRVSENYWLSHIKFAEGYYKKASNGKTSITASVYPKTQNSYKLSKDMISYNRTARKNGEKAAEFDSARTRDYLDFVNEVLKLAKDDPDQPLAPSQNSTAKRAILIAHAGSSRLIDGGSLGFLGANTPGDFMDSFVDTTWGTEFWRGFEVDSGNALLGIPADTIRSVMVTSETASQDGLNWGINGIITSQIGREMGLPYTYDVVKGLSRLGYFDGMDYAGYNAGNGFFPAMPSAFLRHWKGWENATEISPKANEKITVEICAAGADASLCGSAERIIKIPINANEYLLIENRTKAISANGNISAQMANGFGTSGGKTVEISADSLYSHFLDSATQKESGVIESVDNFDIGIPASGIAVWHINDWFIREVIPYGAVNVWNGDTFRDHQFGIALVEADGILGLGKEFRNASGQSAYDFGSGSDLLPHQRFNDKKKFDTVFSVNPQGYGNTNSTFGGFSGIKITVKAPQNAGIEKSISSLTGDSVINFRSLKVPVTVEFVGKYAVPVSKSEWSYAPADSDFTIIPENGYFSLDANGRFKNHAYNIGEETVMPIYADVNNDGFNEAIFLGHNRLYALDSNGIPLPNFPVILSNGEPFANFYSKPLAIDIDGDDSLEVLIPVNNGLLLAVKGNGKLFKDEFPLAAGTFVYEDSTNTKFPMYLHKYVSGDSTFLYAKHRDSVSAFYLPKAKEFLQKGATQKQMKDEITEFFIFPNPVKNGKATARFNIGAPAAKADLDFFDITGFRSFNKSVSSLNAGSNQIDNLDLSKLGSDIYSVRLSVKFASGKRVEKWIRVGVVR